MLPCSATVYPQGQVPSAQRARRGRSDEDLRRRNVRKLREAAEHSQGLPCSGYPDTRSERGRWLRAWLSTPLTSCSLTSSNNPSRKSNVAQRYSSARTPSHSYARWCDRWCSRCSGAYLLSDECVNIALGTSLKPRQHAPGARTTQSNSGPPLVRIGLRGGNEDASRAVARPDSGRGSDTSHWSQRPTRPPQRRRSRLRTPGEGGPLQQHQRQPQRVQTGVVMCGAKPLPWLECTGATPASRQAEQTCDLTSSQPQSLGTVAGPCERRLINLRQTTVAGESGRIYR
jgi:hypothetical protein